MHQIRSGAGIHKEGPTLPLAPSYWNNIEKQIKSHPRMSISGITSEPQRAEGAIKDPECHRGPREPRPSPGFSF